jgi:predicted phosphoribosyltransferase
MQPLFADRREAGRRLASELRAYSGRPEVLVLGLPRGGVVVAYEVATALGAALDAFVVRKLGVPGHEELAMGAIASGGVLALNTDALVRLGIDEESINEAIEQESRELTRREWAFRRDRPAVDAKGRIVILVDDGLATGATMRSAVAALRRMDPAKVVVAVPVGARETCAELRNEADEVVCLSMPEPFGGVGMWYEDFTQTSDDEVSELLRRARGRASTLPGNAGSMDTRLSKADGHAHEGGGN